MPDLIVVGGGLSGCEAAWQAGIRGLSVQLFEMRPVKMTGAHTTSYLAELVCSNSFGSNMPNRASGLLKEELRLLNSIVLDCAETTAVPAGGALAVDRNKFAKKVTTLLEMHPNIEIVRKEIEEIPCEVPSVIASGPLTSPALSEAIKEITNENHLYFYDAISPIVEFESINMNIAFKASRYDRGSLVNGDYINCPFTKEEYINFVTELQRAERIQLKEFENSIEQGVNRGMHTFFEACLPVEIMARRGTDALSFGPMRPVGLINPADGKRPYAVVQLRQDNIAASLYNLVGFQTNLTYSEQRRVFKMIPGLENAEFVRLGQMHRNTFILSPKLLNRSLQLKDRRNIFFAGQITGVEGYISNIGTGYLAGLNASLFQKGEELSALPRTTMLGSLCHYITNAAPQDFQPMKANFGILPPLDKNKKRNKRERAEEYKNRAIRDLVEFKLNNHEYFINCA